MSPRQPYTEVSFEHHDSYLYTPGSGTHASQTIASERLPHDAEHRTEYPSGEWPPDTMADTPTGEVEKAHQEAAAPATDAAWLKGSGMARRILGIVAFVVVVYLLYLGYSRWKADHDTSDGAIFADDGAPISKPSTPPAAPRSATTQVAPASGVALPPGDSLPSNAPNGAAFTGSGKYQVYRQGNITWRVDTQSGISCILFATEDEWRKPVVYQHGCNAS